MTWFKVDDTLATHNKPRQAGLTAMGLWVVSGSYGSQHLTDGYVPTWYVESWTGGKKHAEALVKAGLWTPATDEPGWQFHQWEQANPLRTEELQRRSEQAARQAEWRARRKSVKGA